MKAPGAAVYRMGLLELRTSPIWQNYTALFMLTLAHIGMHTLYARWNCICGPLLLHFSSISPGMCCWGKGKFSFPS